MYEVCLKIGVRTTYCGISLKIEENTKHSEYPDWYSNRVPLKYNQTFCL